MVNVFIKGKIQKMNKDSVSGIVNIKKLGEIDDFSIEFLKY